MDLPEDVPTYDVLDENGDVLFSSYSWGLTVTYYSDRTDRASIRDNIDGEIVARKPDREDDDDYV